MATNPPRAIRLARSFIKEIGTQAQVAAIVGVRQPSVSRWTKNGFSRFREADLRVRFPEMRVWQKFPLACGSHQDSEAR